MKRSLFNLVCVGLVMVMAGCGGKKESVKKEDVGKKEQVTNIFTAFNSRDYDQTQRLIGKFFEEYPEDNYVASFKLMIADMRYESSKFAESFEAYKHFQEMYPADVRAEYAAYKAAHAKFNQANHVTCDSTPIEATIQLCRNYKSHSDYQKYRQQIVDLETTCQRHLIDKELYVVNSYLNQNRLASARHRLKYIKESFDLDAQGCQDKLLFYQAKLARCENNTDGLTELVNDLHASYPRSQFTAMADRL